MKKFLLACALCMSIGLASDALGQHRNDGGERKGIRRGVLNTPAEKEILP